MSLDPSVQAALDTGRIAVLDLVRFDLPGKSVGYHRGGRPFTYNGFTFLPNRYIEVGEIRGDLGVAVQTREILFSNIPTDDPDDIINTIESYAYTNAPVIVTHLLGVPHSNTVIGILNSWIYEINEIRYQTGAMGENGERTLTMVIELEPPGRSARGATHAKRSLAEQQFDNDPTDEGLKYVATNATWPEEWGQRTG